MKRAIILLYLGLIFIQAQALGSGYSVETLQNQCMKLKGVNPFLAWTAFDFKLFEFRTSLTYESSKETLLVALLDEETIAQIAITPSIFSQNLKGIFDSKEYRQALDNCFGQDELMKAIFSLKLIQNELQGREIGVSLSILMYYLPVRYLGILLKFLPRSVSISLMTTLTVIPVYHLYEILADIYAFNEGIEEKQAREQAKKIVNDFIEQGRSLVDAKMDELYGELTRLKLKLNDEKIPIDKKNQIRDLVARAEKNLQELCSKVPGALEKHAFCKQFSTQLP